MTPDPRLPQSFTRRRFLEIGSATGLAIAAGGLVACGDDDEGSGATGGGDGGKIGFSMDTFTVPRWKYLDSPSFERAVKAGGYEAVIAQSNFEVERQINDVKNLLASGVKALAVVPVVSESAVTLVRQAKQQDVPVIAYNTAIPSSDVAVFVARDNIAVGRAAAKAAQEGPGLTGKWVIVSGEAGNAVAEEVTKGYLEILEPLEDSGDVEIVSQMYHKGWDPELARKQAEDVLTKNRNDIQGFLCNNDGMAGGVITALKAQGLAGDVFVSGQDATTEACRSIVLGEMALSSFTRFDVMGETAGKLAVKLADGQSVDASGTYDIGDGETVPFVPIESFNVTGENIVEYLQQYSPDYVDAKAALKGVPEADLPPGAAELVAN